MNSTPSHILAALTLACTCHSSWADELLSTQDQPAINSGEFSFDGVNSHTLRYTQQGQDKIWGGDILLHPSQETASTEQKSSAFGLGIQEGVAQKNLRYRWANGVIPYQFVEDRADYPGLRNDFAAYTSGQLSNLRNVMTDVANEYASKTSVRIVERTAANAAQYPRYVVIGSGGGCFSSVGDVTSNSSPYQVMSLKASGCIYKDVTIHEFGHAFGLWHEQSRSDRDNFVIINTANIADGKAHNFDKAGVNSVDLGDYNYNSIMHYSKYAFSKNSMPTITAISGQNLGQGNNLNAGDVEALNTLYGTDLSITSQVSPNLQANANFDWLISLENKELTLSNRSASEIKVTAQLPGSGYQLVNQTAGWNCALTNNKVNCDRTEVLASKASAQLALTLKAIDSTALGQAFVATVNNLAYDTTTSNNSSTSTGSVLADVAPPEIKNINFGYSDATGALAVQLSWAADPSATEYSIARSQAINGAYTTLKKGISTPYYTDTTALPEKTYYYKLTAKNEFSEEASKEKIAVTPAEPSAAPSPNTTSLASTGGGGGGGSIGGGMLCLLGLLSACRRKQVLVL